MVTDDARDGPGTPRPGGTQPPGHVAGVRLGRPWSAEIAPGVFRLGTPFVGCYAVEDGGAYTFIDAGLPGYWEQMAGFLASRNTLLSAVKAVVLTHWHDDHRGNAERLRTQADARVLVHQDDLAAAMPTGCCPATAFPGKAVRSRPSGWPDRPKSRNAEAIAVTVVREPLGPPAHKPEDARRDVRRAWVSLALLPVAFALATLVGEGLLAVQGYGNAGVGTVSASAALWAGGPGLLVLMAPGAAALFFGLRARRHGRSAGLTPAAIGGVTILGSIALNVLAFLIGR